MEEEQVQLQAERDALNRKRAQVIEEAIESKYWGDGETRNVGLPKRFLLRSIYNNKYVSCNEEGHLLFSDQGIAGLRTRFEFETAKCSSGLVHIRSSYNNKYLMQSSPKEKWIVAAANKPVEDLFDLLSRSLFKPFSIDKTRNTFRLLKVHVFKHHYASFSKVDGRLCISDGETSSPDVSDVFTIIDWDTLVFLPKYVAFKGSNGLFLSAQIIERHEYLKFSASDKGHSSVANEIVKMNDGSIRIKNYYFKKFWRRSPNWIWADSINNVGSDVDTLFFPIKVSDTVIALRNMGNKKICRSLTTEGKTDCLNACDDTVSQLSRLEVVETVLTRKINGVKFHTDRARIYNHKVLTMVYQDIHNENNEPNDTKITLKYTTSTSSTWNTSLSLKLGFKFSLTTGFPLVAQDTIEFSAEHEQAYQWGETKIKTSEAQMEYSVKVPAKSTVRVSVIATEATCDVPFSYTQIDTLVDGYSEINKYEDGVFTGCNCYNFHCASKPLLYTSRRESERADFGL